MNAGIRNEATAAAITHIEISSSDAMQVFLEELTSDQQRRFKEFAHHLVHTGLEDGLSRTGRELSAEERAVILAHQAGLYLMGWNEGNDENKSREP